MMLKLLFGLFDCHTEGTIKRERSMRRKLIKIAAIASLLIGGTLMVVPDAMAVHKESRVRILPNVIDDVMVTRIVPSEPRIELTYHKASSSYGVDNGAWPKNINMGYGVELTDKNIHDLGNKTVEQKYGSVLNVTNIMKVTAEEVTTIWEDGQTIGFYGYMINRNADLTVGSGGRMIYTVTFTTGEVLLGRVDYSRCVNSSVFLNGEATECRMEDLGNGKVQYQPYTSTGARVEIPPEEDAILTEITESWEPPYGWPTLQPDPEPEPIVSEPEPEPITPEPELIEPEPEPVVLEPESTDPVESESTVSGTELTELETSEMPEAGVSETEDTKIELAGFKGDENNEQAPVAEEREVVIEMRVVEDGDGVVEVVKTGDSVLPDGENVATLNSGAVENKNEEVVSREEVAMKAVEEELEVPELGQKTDKKPDIVLPIAIVIGVGTMLVAVWWFLLFGGRKSKERKEGKE